MFSCFKSQNKNTQKIEIYGNNTVRIDFSDTTSIPVNPRKNNFSQSLNNTYPYQADLSKSEQDSSQLEWHINHLTEFHYKMDSPFDRSTLTQLYGTDLDNLCGTAKAQQIRQYASISVMQITDENFLQARDQASRFSMQFV